MTTIAFIHGRNVKAADSWRWLHGLNEALNDAALPGYDRDDLAIVAPVYLDLLREERRRADLPSRTGDGPEDTRLAAQQRYAVELDRLRRLCPPPSKRTLREKASQHLADVDAIVTRYMGLRMADVQNYRGDQTIRAAIIHRILDQLAGLDRIVLIGHSLGSVVALDLLRYLPSDVDVPLLITCGSPVGLKPLHQHLEGRHDRWPYERVGGWLNILDASDIVTGGQGLHGLFPGVVVDAEVDHGFLRDVHAARHYLAHTFVAQAMQPHLPPPSSGDASVDGGDDERAAWAGAIITLAYARELQMGERKGQRRERMESIRVHLEEQEFGEALRGRRPTDHLGELVQLGREMDEAGRVRTLVELASRTPFDPFETTMDDGCVRRALSKVAGLIGAEPGLSEEISLLAEEVSKALTKRPWARYAATVGTVALGLALPAALPAVGGAGVAGAAAITRGLAILGGSAIGGVGMTGGLWVLTLAGAGSGAAAARALETLSAQQVAGELIKYVTTVRMLRRHGLGQSGEEEMLALRELHVVANEREKLHQGLDEEGGKSTMAREWRDKAAAASNALRHLDATADEDFALPPPQNDA